ncbi:phosphatase PAP2 family protein [Streptomyces sp. NBC_01306]|uniref:phosphatase PAP2 family protein n=1 Tax=Streptomyces sp. NBC_01306 TaxID=2903819 RepID=UPI00225B09FA|nr:phosphatase PAP2 family protein [Streptomyces sp. NBC_01306]MCX4724766.1 phosphatase PAP2 family protein [Streptomyces sp. NBC_01306]
MDSSSELYRNIVEFAHSTPSWVQQLMELWTEGGLLLFAVLFVFVWWRSRTASAQAMALALIAPLGTAIAYVLSEVLKSVIHEERPCRAVAGAMKPLIDCPAPGDWSFPSNHSIIAAAAAVGLSVAMVRLVWLTVPVAVLMAFSRVFVGVHYPHDVIVGLLLGALIGLLVIEGLTRPVRSLVETVRSSDISAAAWFVGPGAPN